MIRRCQGTSGPSRVGYPPAPDGYTIYVVGDIHGRLDLLEKVHFDIDQDRNEPTREGTVEVYLGDYIDRGPESAQVITRLIARSRQARTVFLRGNHEQLLLDFLSGRECLDQWKAIGAVASFLSYGVATSLFSREVPQDEVRRALAESLPHEHVQFYADTASYCDAGLYLFVHAGVRPGVSLEDQTTQDLLGIRDAFLQFKGDLGRIVVHGHTPVMSPDWQANRINIDTGAFATNRLTCLRIGDKGPSILR